jgi:hypothetical protein
MVDWKGLLFGLVPLLAGIGIVVSVLGDIRGGDAASREAAGWPTTTGTVTRTWIETSETVGDRGRRHTLYAPRVAYDYEVQGVRYSGERLSLNQAHQQAARRDAENELKSYAVGTSVEVHYDPNAPGISALIIEGTGSISWLGVGVGALVALFGAWVLFNVLRPKRPAAANEASA